MHACIRSGEITLDVHEHFVKQTIRNRALIYGANGMLPLIIPVRHENLYSKPIGDVRISYDQNWQRIHWKSIVSAYRHSAYFDFLEEDLAPFYIRRHELLTELNVEMLKALFRMLKVSIALKHTEEYLPAP